MTQTNPSATPFNAIKPLRRFRERAEDYALKQLYERSRTPSGVVSLAYRTTMYLAEPLNRCA